MHLPKFNERNYVHFVTAKTFENHACFGNDDCCRILLEDLDFYRKRIGFKVLGYVIMPDHLHCLVFWDVEECPELTVSKIMQRVKGHCAKQILSYLQTGRRKPSLSPYSASASEGSHLPRIHEWRNTGRVHTEPRHRIWQKGFYDSNIYTEKKLREKMDYIHSNPVMQGLSERPEDYQWSSYRQIAGIDENPKFRADSL
jgi:REP element-mobilizing transposase RayT